MKCNEVLVRSSSSVVFHTQGSVLSVFSFLLLFSVFLTCQELFLVFRTLLLLKRGREGDRHATEWRANQEIITLAPMHIYGSIANSVQADQLHFYRMLGKSFVNCPNASVRSAWK